MPYRLATPQYVQGPRLWPPAENNEAASPELPGLPYPAIAGRADTLDSHYGATQGTRTPTIGLEDRGATVKHQCCMVDFPLRLNAVSSPSRGY